MDSKHRYIYLRSVARVLFPAALIAVLAAIWALTVQTPDQTTSLSSGWAQAIAQLLGISMGDASWAARKLAHTVEFFPVGFFLALSAVSWLGDRMESGRNLVIVWVVALCFACSLGDQVHKLFVPGREFDALDMVFDAVGYALGIAAAHAIACKMVR